jgi:hypothetical protein
MPSVAETYGTVRISEAQLRRLYAIAYGSHGAAGALFGNARERANQLHSLIQRWGYDWDGVDQNTDPKLWLKQTDYDEIVSELLAMRGGL